MNKTWNIGRVLAGLAGLAGLFLFLNPALAGIINIGNATGAVLSGALAFCAACWKHVKAACRSLWKHLIGRILLVGGLGVLALSVAAGLVLTVFMVRAAGNTPPVNATVLVLGCKVNGQQPSRMLKSRLDKALTYLQDNPDSRCIVSGGRGEGEEISEAEAMYRYLVEHGIDGGRIFKEDMSVNTEENIRFSAEIIAREGLDKKVALATDGFHQMRSAMLAEREELTPYAVSARTVWYLFPTYYVRELFALMDRIFLK